MNRRSFLAALSTIPTVSLAGCAAGQLPVVGESGTQPAIGSPDELPARQSSPYDTMYPDTQFEYSHAPDSRTLTISHTGGAEITPENTEWAALYTSIRPRTVDQEGKAPTFVTAWNIAGGDTEFPMKEGENTVVDGIDIDHNVQLEWCEPGGKLRNWERWDIWRDYFKIGYFSMEFDEKTDELVIGRPNDEDTLAGTGGYSVTLVVDRDFENEYVLASPDGGPWGFPIESGSSIRVPVDELSARGRVEPYWLGPNGFYSLQGTTDGAVTLD